MKSRMVMSAVTVGIVAIAMLLVPFALGAPPFQVDPTQQQQTIDAAVNQLFAQTVEVDQLLGATQTIQLLDATQTMEAVREQAQAATVLAQTAAAHQPPTVTPEVLSVETREAGWDPETTILKVWEERVAVHSGPSLGYGVIGYISPGQTYEAIGRNWNRQWIEIAYESRTGWVCVEKSEVDGSIRDLPIREYSSYRCDQSHNQEMPDGSYAGTHPEDAEIVFVNGIQTTYDQHINDLHALVNAFDSPSVMGIYNASATSTIHLPLVTLVIDSGQALSDIVEGITSARLGSDNEAVMALVRLLKSRRGSPLIIVGHSQGTAIISAALGLLSDDGVDLSNLTVYTFADVAVSFPVGPAYFHCIHLGDSIATAPVLHRAFLAANLDAPNTVITRILGPKPVADPLWGWENHLLPGYIKNFERDFCPRSSEPWTSAATQTAVAWAVNVLYTQTAIAEQTVAAYGPQTPTHTATPQPGQDPVSVAREWANAIGELDVWSAGESTCEVYAADVRESLTTAKLLIGLLSLGTLGNEALIDWSGVEFTLIQSTPTTAMVHVEGMYVPIVGESEYLNENMPLVYESGRWKVCQSSDDFGD